MTLLALAAVGCGTSSDGSASGTPARPATTAPGTPTQSTQPAPSGSSGGPPATATPAPSATSAASPAPQPSVSVNGTRSPRCTVTDLRLRLGRGDPGAGNIYYPLEFTNIAGHPCALNGFPGVSLLRGDGSVIGRPAAREGARGTAVRLEPGQTVEADLHTLNQGVREGGCWRTPTLIMVYPPGSTDAMTLATSNPVVCGDTFDVGTVH